MNKVPTFCKVMNFEENSFREVKIHFVCCINALPDDMAIAVLLASYGLLKDYRNISTLSKRRKRLCAKLSLSYDDVEDIESLAIEEVAKSMIALETLIGEKRPFILFAKCKFY